MNSKLKKEINDIVKEKEEIIIKNRKLQNVINDIVKEKEEIINHNIKLQNEINYIVKEKEEIINLNTKLQNEINDIKKLLKKKEEIIITEKNDKKELNNKVESLQKMLIENFNTKENEIKELKSKILFEISKAEKLMSVIIVSKDEAIYYSFLCKNTDKLTKIEELFYEKYPEYNKKENYFIINGNKINKEKTLEENKISNSDIITIINNND